MKTLAILAASASLSASAAMADFSMSFSGWGNIPSCTNGSPNTVGNPAFTLNDVPPGTTQIEFRLKDLDVPNYNHGGGKMKLQVNGSVKIPAGSFKYKSPCPPSGRHTYEWTATAMKGGKALAKASARKQYP
ncbi:hypothetical protein KO498_04860 [Lentibacter algarum]|uniref:hypothetical protein n=1 Tax=Lentibacter algarum TaxID=576131 RepID=UPI001C069083|nr:hypothetical protein [Lentibacter algarum]MBU2981140.1 hypothetical protein [Lentibacter algarum]